MGINSGIVKNLLLAGRRGNQRFRSVLHCNDRSSPTLFDKGFLASIAGDTVVVSSPLVPSPEGVHYAFTENPAGANLYNRAGLPARPFRTDNW